MADQDVLRTERFADFVRDAARRAGYDIDSPRGGGKTALSRDTGMSPSSVGRVLAGKTMPDPAYLEPLARALRVALPELLVLSGLVSRDVLSAQQPARSLSPREAAADLGIRDPAKIELFETMVRALLTDQNISSGGRSSEGEVA
ncbi:helix-turn-helix transcriptional regulator [Streptomyces sp. NBC_01571]|uniref:helix-turn-helix domain-containing protein n=1 Tax=Streptomyces sp. NBC_01571 TaxID=2975883 RepID=UPI00225C1462|nr:helix-turn-helix transcriptional regulator [Streptomyces sp. NBC_01571]MCX4578151.1 helix-turn-helix transcriptional regulator [Streptomyces sp. NBC_01571]